MELFSNESHFVLVDAGHSLWINRKKCTFTNKEGITITSDFQCMGVVYGFIGKLVVGDAGEPHLIFIREASRIGILSGSDVFKINSILIVPLQRETELILEMCVNFEHQTGKTKLPNPAGPKGRTFCKSKPPIIQSTDAKVGTSSSSPKSEKLARVERRILEEVQKMFSEARSFYYAHTYDLTNAVQRQVASLDKTKRDGKAPPLWQRTDQRFFWNHYMLHDLIESNDPTLNRWILPIIQGFIQTDHIILQQLSELSGTGHPRIEGEIDIWVISRRSRHRAGTRYLRRGVDESGHVANYVESEQILIYRKHIISYIQSRGSVPVFWSQPGYRYRPPPKIDRNADENLSAFRKHVESECSLYGSLMLINLVEKSGKEKVLGDAYCDQVLRHNSKQITYISFDFHDHCRGMHFENVGALIKRLEKPLKDMNFCWVDDYGLVMKQDGICRVNCVDCLDRTNVVQTAIAKFMLTFQMNKLGILMPEVGLPDRIVRSIQSMWANNGDTISRQYAGTNALKGDYTRTGERRLAISALKDGMNSANRYYRNRFLDASRQAAIDVQLGIRKDITEDELQESVKIMEDKENTPEQIKSIIDDTKKCIVPKTEVVLGAWGLVNGSENAPDVVDVDTILLLTETHYYATGYDCQMDSITDTEKISLKWITKLELGNEALDSNSKFWGLFGTTKQEPTGVPLLKITYSPVGHAGALYFHFFRSSSVRFFNNVCVLIKNHEEMHEALKMIGESIEIASRAQDNDVTLQHVQLLSSKEERGPRAAPSITSWVQSYFRNDNSESDLVDRVISVPKMKSKYFGRFGASSNKPKEDDEQPGPSRQHDGSKKKKKNEIVPDPSDLDREILENPSSQHMSSIVDPDLVLPSCGIIYTVSSNINGDHKLIPSLPSLDSTTCTQLDNLTLSTNSSLRHHRQSLPTNSLNPSGLASSDSKLPEITINEEPEEPLPLPKSTNLTKRICKSSEDVNVTRHGVKGAGIKKELLSASGEPIRSNSDLDLFGASQQISMKESRSDNAIKRTNNPFQRFSQNPPFKKDLVFAPLGKLARGMQIGVNYLHPKKLRDTFKSATNKEPEPLTAEELEELRILEERKMNSNSLFIDI